MDVIRAFLGNRLWRPIHAQVIARDVFRIRSTRSDDEHLRSAARWIARAQDVMPDGGVAGRYSLRTGWTSSYPETTGYLVPTLLALAKVQSVESYRERAARAIEFLLRCQLPNGAFPGGEVHENTTEPSVFNSGQILRGLTSWHRETGEERVAEAARRVADWLVSVQDQDGSWRRYVYQGVATTYTAHASCWLADAGVHFDETVYREAARRHLRWVLLQVAPETGWIDLAGFNSAQHGKRIAYTHTLAYALRGVLVSSRLLGEDEGVAVAEHAADRIADTLQAEGWLPGVLGSDWTGKARFACVTGTAQMAQIWLALHAQGGRRDFLEAAVRALDLVKQAQVIGIGGVDIEGGIPGSYPVWGAYVPFAYPNWAAKFFIDAMLAKQRATGVLPGGVVLSD